MLVKIVTKLLSTFRMKIILFISRLYKYTKIWNNNSDYTSVGIAQSQFILSLSRPPKPFITRINASVRLLLPLYPF
jgi:hypothetical protein